VNGYECLNPEEQVFLMKLDWGACEVHTLMTTSCTQCCLSRRLMENCVQHCWDVRHLTNWNLQFTTKEWTAVKNCSLAPWQCLSPYCGHSDTDNWKLEVWGSATSTLQSRPCIVSLLCRWST